ncbi:dephospho-CoA kinase [Wenyingzhuangia sp. IMCC45574]
MVVGLTGGIGSGKSTVARAFQELGVPCYIADLEAKKLMVESSQVRAAIIDLLGKEAYEDNNLNRAYIASKVFKDKELLAQLNAIVHPAVHKDLKDFVARQTSSYCLYESAILFENKNEHLCDKIIVVTANLEERIQRVMKRDGVGREAILERINNQWSQEKKIEKADFIIKNNVEEELKEQVLQLHQQFSN